MSITAAEIMAAMATLEAAPKISYVMYVSDEFVAALRDIEARVPWYMRVLWRLIGNK